MSDDEVDVASTSLETGGLASPHSASCRALSTASRPLIDPGGYPGKFSHWETKAYRGYGGKLALCITVDDGFGLGGVLLARYYRCSKLENPVGRGGGFVVSEHSDYARDRAIVIGAHTPDDMSPAIFLGKNLWVVVRTVERDQKGRLLHPAHQYSVIDSFRLNDNL